MHVVDDEIELPLLEVSEGQVSDEEPAQEEEGVHAIVAVDDPFVSSSSSAALQLLEGENYALKTFSSPYIEIFLRIPQVELERRAVDVAEDHPHHGEDANAVDAIQMILSSPVAVQNLPEIIMYHAGNVPR